jgi:serine/threonine protein kinase
VTSNRSIYWSIDRVFVRFTIPFCVRFWLKNWRVAAVLPLATFQICVGTSFYRAPELLLGDRRPGEAIDTWAVGCVLTKLLTGKPLFSWQGDIEQPGFITNLLGSPDETRWPGFSQVADFGQIEFKGKDAHDIRQAFPTWNDHAVDLFKQFITYEPGKRISASEALNHDWFFTEPVPMIASFEGISFDLMNGTYIQMIY